MSVRRPNRRITILRGILRESSYKHWISILLLAVAEGSTGTDQSSDDPRLVECVTPALHSGTAGVTAAIMVVEVSSVEYKCI